MAFRNDGHNSVTVIALISIHKHWRSAIQVCNGILGDRCLFRDRFRDRLRNGCGWQLQLIGRILGNNTFAQKDRFGTGDLDNGLNFIIIILLEDGIT